MKLHFNVDWSGQIIICLYMKLSIMLNLKDKLCILKLSLQQKVLLLEENFVFCFKKSHI